MRPELRPPDPSRPDRSLLGQAPPKARRNTLAFAALVVAILYLAPYGRLVLLPAIYLNTHLHELAHALAGIATGGTPIRIVVAGDGSGFCVTAGGLRPVVSSAGYLGASILGAGMVLLARSEAGARTVLGGLAAILALSMVLLVREDAVGIVSGLFWIVALAFAARRLKGDLLIGFAQFLGLIQGLQSLTSIGDLLRISATARVNSDAQTMAELTGIPALVWAGLWAAFSLGITGWALVRASRSHRASPPGG